MAGNRAACSEHFFASLTCIIVKRSHTFACLQLSLKNGYGSDYLKKYEQILAPWTGRSIGVCHSHSPQLFQTESQGRQKLMCLRESEERLLSAWLLLLLKKQGGKGSREQILVLHNTVNSCCTLYTERYRCSWSKIWKQEQFCPQKNKKKNRTT